MRISALFLILVALINKIVVRTNLPILVENLTDEHLLAEYREIKRLLCFTLLKI